MSIRVSVIVPVYNGEKMVRSCINSILNQTLKDIEIIVINDGSSDNTKAVLESIYDDRIRIIHTENSGQGSARNLGISLAKGEYVAFVDCDDTIDENMLSVMADKISDAEVCQCNILDIYPDGTKKKQLLPLNETVTITNRKKYFDNFVFKPKHSFECCNKLFKKSFLIDNKITFGDNKEVYSEDLLFNLNLVKHLNKIVFIDDVFYFYYQNDGSHSNTNSIDKLRKLCRLFDMVYDEEYKYQISKIGVLIIMLNLSKTGGATSEILSRKDVKKYIYLSMLSMKNPKHKIIMANLLYMPMMVKKLIIKFYYGNLG